MDLLSDSAYWLAGFLALLAIAGGGWLTARTRRGWRGIVLNALVVLLAGLLLVTSVGLVLNRQNGWYASPGDVLPGVHVKGNAETYGGGSPFADEHPAAHAPGATESVAPLPPLPQPGQRVQNFTVPTSVGKRTWAVRVILPADYFAAGAEQQRFPVLYAGHGFPGGPEQYTSAFDLQKMGDEAVRAKRIRPFIIVIPDITPGGADTECVFGPDDPQQLETWLAKDIPGFLAAHLRVAPGRTNSAWLGFSLGAWCGTMLTMRHPETFGAAAALGGYFQPWWVGPPPWPPSDPRAADYDLVALAEKRPPAVALWVQTSRKDSQSWPRTEKFLKTVRPPMALTAVIDATGGHTFTSWVKHGPDALAWLGKTVPGFAV